jgi:hypothetical protein
MAFSAYCERDCHGPSGLAMTFCKGFLQSNLDIKKGWQLYHPFFISYLIFFQTTWTFRPWKRTCPSAVANNVKSLPIPTLQPGKNFVPHWRTMIEPAETLWPPNRFTPLYFGLLSLPFLEEPCPFL